MTDQTRSDDFLKVLCAGLQARARQLTQATLGERLHYIGMSDLGRYSDCPRAAIASKLVKQKQELKRLLPLQRGHWFEEGITRSLETLGLHVLPQLEIRNEVQSIPIRAHLDLTVAWTKPFPAIRVVEVKSLETIPDRPYDSHVLQLQGQISLLSQCWNKSAFSLSAETGTKQHNPMPLHQLCRKVFNIELPQSPTEVSIEGWLLYVSMKDAKVFGPYSPDKDFLSRMQKSLSDYWEYIRKMQNGLITLSEIPYAQGYYPLCASCSVNANCPKFIRGSYQPQWEPAIKKLTELKQERSRFETEIKEIESALKQAHTLSGTQDWIYTGQHRFRLSVIAGRRSLNEEKLEEDMKTTCALREIEAIDIIGMLRRNECEGNPSMRLTISPMN